MIPGSLYVVATPIGNLGDVSPRAIEALRAADLIACEDTRTSRTLLARHAIAARTVALHEHNERAAAPKLLRAMHAGKSVALISDAGTSAISSRTGATFISPFLGRLDDIATPGMALIGEIVQIYRNYPELKTAVLAASIRSPLHVVESAKLGAHVATLPPAVLRQMYAHPLTEKGLAAFVADWKKTGQSILGDDEKAAAE